MNATNFLHFIISSLVVHTDRIECIVLSGGGALLRGLDTLLHNVLNIPIYVAEDPLTAVARGTGVILDEFEFFKEVLLNTDDTSVSR